MHAPHVASGGRYPVLRTLAILYLFAAVAVLALGIWRAVSILASDAPVNDVFGGVATNMGGKTLVALSWLATTFIGVLAMFGVAELIKLFIDIERNTRLAGMRGDVATTGATATTSAAAGADGPGVGEGVPGGSRVRQMLEGEETAEGALIRGH